MRRCSALILAVVSWKRRPIFISLSRDAARNFEALLIPGLLCVFCTQHPIFRCCHRASSSPLASWSAIPSFQEPRIRIECSGPTISGPRSRLQPISLGKRCVPPPAGNRPRVTSGKPSSILGIINNHPVVAGQCQFQAAAQRSAIDCHSYRLATGFQLFAAIPCKCATVHRLRRLFASYRRNGQSVSDHHRP